jgi:hypothetical protein
MWPRSSREPTPLSHSAAGEFDFIAWGMLSMSAAGRGQAPSRIGCHFVKLTIRCLLKQARVERTSQTQSPGRRQMKAHIDRGGFGGLVAAAYLIRNAGVPGQDITI